MAFRVDVRVGRPRGIRGVDARLGAALAQAVGEETIKRVQKRVDHPAARGLSVSGVNQYRATVRGSRGGPGIIRPVKKKALFWPGARHPVMSVRSKGLGPLIEAEARRVEALDVNETIV